MSKINYYLLICYLIFPSPKLFSSNPVIDSLLNVFQTEYETLPRKGKAELLHELGLELHFAEQHVEAEKYFRQSLKLSAGEKFKYLTIDNYYYLGIVRFWQSDYKGAIGYLQQSLDVFPKDLTPEDSIYIFDEMGAAYFYMGDLDLSLECRLKSLRIVQSLSDSTFLAGSLFALAEIEMEQKNYDQALKYVQESLDVSEKTGDDHYINYCFDLLGDIYHEKKDFEKALAYKIKSCEVLDAGVEVYLSAYCDHSLALTYMEMGDHERAISLFSSALAKREESNQLEEAAESMACLGALLAKQGDCGTGLNMMEQSLKNAKELGIKPLLREIYQKLYTIANHCGSYEKAVKYQEKYFLFRDSISNEKTQMRIANLNAKHELDALELDVLHKDQRLSTLYIVLLCMATALLLLAAIFIFWLYKKQRSDSRIQAERTATLALHNAALESANQRLVKANTQLEQFAYISSHDLKAPLRTIGSYASLVNRRYKDNLDDDGRKFLRYITEDAKHMYTLLENVLAYSQVDQSDEAFKKVDLNLSLEKALRLLNGTIWEKNAKIDFSDFPTVMGNETQLLQVFQNLIDNALKFIPSGRQPHIQIKAAEEPEHYRFSVQDNGIGISPDMQSKIFAPFKRLHKRNEYQGTGIGLAICRKVVERHGGKIWVESDKGAGTVFYFTIKKILEAEPI